MTDTEMMLDNLRSEYTATATPICRRTNPIVAVLSVWSRYYYNIITYKYTCYTYTHTQTRGTHTQSPAATRVC